MTLKEKDKKYIWHPFDQMKGADILPIVKGEGSLVFDEDGKDYIDGFSSWWVNAHGHSNSYIANKISEQLNTLEHVAFGGFTHPQAINLSERLINITPKNIKKIFFSDNGSTANEIALKMSIQFWNNKGKPRDKFIALEGDYHGDTFGSMCLTSRGGFNEPFEKFMFDVDFIKPPQKDNINEVLEQFEKILKTDRVAAFIFEPLVQGAYGMKTHDAVGLSKMMKLAKKYGVICIADEVFTGFGRTGTWFACNQLSELPDIMCLSKALTGGFLPLGLTLVSQEIYDGFYSDIPTHTFLHGHSFTGNPLSCCAANASLDLFQQEKTWTRIAEIEKSLEKFCKIVSMNKNVREARHLGIILAIEIDAGGKSSYFNNIGKVIYKELLNKGVILRPLGNTIVVVPPYCITDDELNKMYSAIVEVLSLLN